MLVLVQQGQLIDEDSSEGESCAVGKPFGWHLALPVEDALELPALKVCVWVRSVSGGY
jgi:hypothetical protein